jgi:hypothetical protein
VAPSRTASGGVPKNAPAPRLRKGVSQQILLDHFNGNLNLVMTILRQYSK